tara:strand:- start:190 stop:603 length:414 start_codon:yes stop_codon:yes gene_type:complete
MPQITYDGDTPFTFGYGGRTYIVPPKQGGKWEVVHEQYVDDYGFARSRRVLTKTGESKRNFIDVPAGAVRHLFKNKIKQLHKNRIRVIDDAMSQVEHELKDIQAARAQLEAEKQELADRIAALEAKQPATKKAPRKR